MDIEIPDAADLTAASVGAHLTEHPIPPRIGRTTTRFRADMLSYHHLVVDGIGAR